ncbi:ribosome biogenesis protein Pescadillo [Peziza echinospora]|nr:ribosome biogenesis protein Pescadillo [Peziza echinospora]
MARAKKKGTSGAAKAYLTRTQAVKKLQISLANFRRLCIFKGIYPREPRNKKKVSKSATPSTVFYYTRDIQYLQHEPVLQKFRDHKVFAKKLKRAIGRGDYTDAKRLERDHAPQISLDHIIKERYPTFTDALRDLDDALSLLHTFANLPSFNGIPPDVIADCETLCNEWQHYVMRTNTLRKSFLSIKGIYYQAEIEGQDILWLVPYKFAQNAPLDVDYRVMRTFVDFYQVLLRFVLFKLYTMEGLVYPPKFDSLADSKGAGLRAFSLESKGTRLLTNGSTEEFTEGKDVSKQLKTLNDKIATISNGGEEDESTAVADQEEANAAATDSIDTFEPISATADVLAQPTNMTTSSNGTTTDPTKIFAPFTFYLSRETPRTSLEFILRSFGCKRIGWDAVLGDGAYTENERDPNITHQVVDRPPQLANPDEDTEMSGNTQLVRGGRIPGRIYVQPQYIWDCINAGKLLRPEAYLPGTILPPHLSPWVKPTEGAYDPTAPLPEDEDLSDSEEEEEEDEDVDVDGGVPLGKKAGNDAEGDFEGMTVDTAQSDDEEEESDSDSDGPGFDNTPAPDLEAESDDEEELARAQHQAELEAEATGAPVKNVVTAASERKKRASKKVKEAKEEEEQKEMKKMMLPRKKRKLYEKMIHSNKKKEGEVKVLQDKRRKLEKEQKKKAT